MTLDAQSPVPAAGKPNLADWQRLASKEMNGADPSTLRSRTRDGIVIEPFYESAAGALPLLGRGARRWTIVQNVDHPDPEDANRQALDDLKGGATGLSIRVAGAPSAAGFGLPSDAAALAAALDGIDLAGLHVRIEPHADGPAIASWLRSLIERSGLAPERAAAAFGLDPIAIAATAGTQPDADAWVNTFRDLRAAGLRGPFAELDTRVYHEAGASEAQELAAMLGSAAWWLRRLDATNVSPGDAVAYLGATLAVDRDEFLSIAKLRAARLLWARLAELCGAAEASLRIHAETSRRMLTRADPHTNLLRNTIAAFAAGVGGADSIVILPHDSARGLPDRGARALARNTQHILSEEAHLHRIADPAAGSGVVEALTDALAERAWAAFQTLEREGGIDASLRAGAFPARIAAARQALRTALANGESPLVGATMHRLPDDTPAPDTAARTGAAAAAGLRSVRLDELAGAA
jgi:methylmalonyl-CoA mutase